MNKINNELKEFFNSNRKIILIVVFSLFFLSLLISILFRFSFFESLRLVFGSFYVLFLPGFILTFIFFPKNSEKINEKSELNGSIDVIERITLSIALSISVVPLFVFYMNLIGIKITLFSVFFEILAIILISLAILIKRSF